VRYGLPEQVGKAAQFLGAEKVGKALSDYGKEGMGEQPRGAFEQAGEMIPESVGVPLATEVIGRGMQLIPHPAAKIAGMAVRIAGRFATPALFGLAQAQTTKETAEERGVEPGVTPLVTGGIEWAGETAANIALGRILGPLAMVGKAGKESLKKMGAGQALKGSIGSYLKELALVTAPTEILTEMGQNYFEALAEQRAGIRPEAKPGEEAMSAIAPTAIMTAILGPFGRLAQRHVANRQAEFLATPVNQDDPNAEGLKEVRLKIAEGMAQIIPEDNAALRGQWMAYATDKIQKNEPIDITSPLDSLSMQIDTLMGELPDELDVVKPPAVPPSETDPAAPVEAPAPEVGVETTPDVTPAPAPPLTSQPIEEALPPTTPVAPEEPTPTKVDIDEKANEAATSGQNNIPQPTQAQIEAGNYKKGHINVHGLDITVENPAGSTRKGIDENGKEWETPIVHHYGYIRKTEGKDGDHVDVFVGPNPDSQKAFIVDQKNPKTGKFDEHKTLLGFNSPEEAREGYLANYDQTGPSRIMGITEMSVDQFKDWVKNGNTKARVSKESAPEVAPPIPPLAEQPPETTVPPSPEPIVEPGANLEAAPVTPDHQYATEAEKYGVKFNGMQERPGGKPPFPVFTMNNGKGTTFMLTEGETLPDAIKRVQGYSRKVEGGEPRFSPQGYSSEAEALVAIKSRKLNIADFTVAKEGKRWTVSPKGEVSPPPAETAKPVEKSVAAPAKNEEVTTPKEQKKYLISAIDEALKEAPANVNIKYSEKSEANDQFKQRIDLENTPTITIDVPGDGTFTIVNDKPHLETFKKMASKFPVVEKATGTITQPRTAPTGKRIAQEGVEYYNEFKPRKQAIITTSLDKDVPGQTRNYYDEKEGWYSNGHYAIKITKPQGIKYSDKPLDIKKVIPTKNTVSAKVIGEFHTGRGDAERESPQVHIMAEDGGSITASAAYVDAVLTKYPNAKAFMAENASPISPVLFKDKGKPVAVVMPTKLNIDILDQFTDRIAEITGVPAGEVKLSTTEGGINGQPRTTTEDRNLPTSNDMRSPEDTTRYAQSGLQRGRGNIGEMQEEPQAVGGGREQGAGIIPPTENMTDRAKAALLGLDADVTSAWQKKVEEYKNELRRTVPENRDEGVAGGGYTGRADEVLRESRLRDERIIDAKVQGELTNDGRERWKTVHYSPSLAGSVEFMVAREHFATYGYHTVPITRVDWNGCVDYATKTVFLGENDQSILFYTATHETGHILSSQNTEEIRAIKDSIDLSNEEIRSAKESRGWDDDYTREEFAAAIVGGMEKPQWVSGNQSDNIKAARDKATKEGSKRKAPPTGEAYSFISPSRKPFYSKLADVVQSASFIKMPAPQLRAFLKGKQVTDAEIENIVGGLEGTVTKQQVLDEIKANSTEFQDVVLGSQKFDRRDAERGIKQTTEDSWILDGDEFAYTIRERGNEYTVTRLNRAGEYSRYEEYVSDVGQYNTLDAAKEGLLNDVEAHAPVGTTETHFSQFVEPGAVEGSYREMFVTAPKEANIKYSGKPDEGGQIPFEVKSEGYAWQDGHSQYSDITNPIVRIRFNEREVDGNRILFVEEIQGPSDANQQKMPEWLRKRIYDIGVKRVLSYAKENGFDGVAWTTGEMQAGRYSLEKQIDTLNYDPDNQRLIAVKDGSRVIDESVPSEKLPDYVGKEVAQRLLDSAKNGAGNHEISGLDLKVGGEGLKTLYDRTLPAMFKKYGKEGASEIGIQTGKYKSGSMGEFAEQHRRMYPEATNADIIDAFGKKNESIFVPFIPITEKTPESFTQYGDIAPKFKLPEPMKRVMGTLLSTFTDNPQNMPEELNRTLNRSFQGLKKGELSALDYALSNPFHMSQKYPKEWGPMWRIHGIERAEKRSDLRARYIKIADPYFTLDDRLKEEGLDRTQRQEAKDRVIRMVFATDATLHNELVSLLQEIKGKTGVQFDTIQKRINEIRTLRRYSDDQLREGIVDEYGNTIKLNRDTEIAAYTSIRRSLDELLAEKIDWLNVMAFRKWKNQKWYNLLLQAAGTDLSKDEVQTLLGKKGLNAAAINYAKKMQVDIGAIFSRIEDKITETPEGEITAAGEKYGKLATKVSEELLKLQTHLGKMTGITDKEKLSQLTRDLFAAYVQTRPYLKKIKALRNQMGMWVGYAPRTREQGKFKIRLVEQVIDDETGAMEEKHIHSEMFNTKAEYKQIYADILKKYGDKEGNLPENQSITSEPVTVSPETAFQGVNDVNTQKIIDDAISNMRIQETYYDAKGNPIDVYDQLRDAAYESIANQFMQRGAGRASIHRSQGGTIKGYDEQNLDRVLLSYISSMTGLMTKQIAAADALDHLKTIKNPSMFAGLSKYNREMLRNDSRGDEISGMIRGGAFVWFLGGLLKSAAVNLTQNPIVGFAELHKYMKEHNLKGIGDVEYSKALKDVLADNLTEKEKQFTDELVNKGVAQDQYIQSIFEGLHGKLAQNYLGVARFLAIPFSASERYNRKSAGVALFRQAYPMYLSQGLSEEDAYRKAFDDTRTFIDNVHYAYGKANRPLWMQSGGIPSQLLHTAYTFRGFTHNFLIRQATLLSQGDWKTFLHTMSYIAVLGGLMGLPFFKDFFDWVEKKYGYSPTRYVRNTLRGIGGKTLEEFGMNGLPAVLGANISGSLAVGLPYPIGAPTPEDTLFGVWSGVAQKAQRGVEAAGRGDWSRARQEVLPEFFRAPGVAMRESELGRELLGEPGFATTPQGRAITGDEGKPLSLKGSEVLLRAVGFNPTEYSHQKEENRRVLRQEAWASEAKRDAAEEYRVAKIKNDPKALANLVKAVKEINEGIRIRGIEKLVPPAKLSTILQSSREVRGLKERREAAYKKG
jgi:hypothetical protein